MKNNKFNKVVKPTVVLDLTNENITVEEAIAECEQARQTIKKSTFYTKLVEDVKSLWNKVKNLF